MQYDIQLAGGIRTAIFGGEGLFLATLTGPGKIIIQSLTLEKMRRELAPYRAGGDEHKGGWHGHSGGVGGRAENSPGHEGIVAWSGRIVEPQRPGTAQR